MDKPLPKMPEMNSSEAEMGFVTNRKSRRAMAKRDGVFKKGREWQVYNKIIKEAK